MRFKKWYEKKPRRNVRGFFNSILEKIVYRLNFSLNGGINVGSGAQIGRYIFITNPMGVSIGEGSIVGEHLDIHRGVNLGGKDVKYPTIGNNVKIGSQAHILGDVKVGDGSVIGAMTLVIKDVEPNTVVAGIPARVIRKIREGEQPDF